MKHDTKVRYDTTDTQTTLGKMYYKDMTLLTPVGRRHGYNHGPGIMRSGVNTRCGISATGSQWNFCASILYEVVWKSVGGGRSTSVPNPTILNGPMLLMKK
ncbi:MAG: hypothetical protein N4A38_05990 [Candidatus Gracilibacteria bacterium]|nr:hypothetical protein [Candidatus Gracilibacteria bacterium]